MSTDDSQEIPMIMVPERSATVEKVTEILTRYRDTNGVGLDWGRKGKLEHDGHAFKSVPQEAGFYISDGRRRDEVHVTWIEPEDMRGEVFENSVRETRQVMHRVYSQILLEAGYLVDRRFTPCITVSIGGLY